MDEDWRPAFRVEAVPSYKAHRLAEGQGAQGNDEQTPDALVPQIPIINDVLAATGLAVAGAPGYEADDVIATLAVGADQPVDVITGDRDLFQLVDDEHQVRIVYTVRGLNNLDIIDEQAVADRYKIPGRSYADFAVLRGDPSDGLPGVPGVGEKTAATLINKFGSLAAILEAVDAGHGGFPTGARNKLTAARDYLDVAPMVVRTATDVPLPPVTGDLPLTPADPAGSPSSVSGGGSARRCPASSPRSPGSSLLPRTPAQGAGPGRTMMATSELYPAARLAAVAERVRAEGLDALLLTPGADLRYVTGYDAKQLERLTCLVIPAADPAFLVVPRLELAAAQASPASGLGLELIPWEETEDPYALIADRLDRWPAPGWPTRCGP